MQNCSHASTIVDINKDIREFKRVFIQIKEVLVEQQKFHDIVEKAICENAKSIKDLMSIDDKVIGLDERLESLEAYCCPDED